MPNFRVAKIESVEVQCVIRITVKMGTVEVLTWFGVFKSLAVYILLYTAYIDRCMEGFFLIDRMIVPINSAPVQILGRDQDLSNI